MIDLPASYDNYTPRTDWCEREPLLRRIADEAYRAARYRMPFSILLVNLAFFNRATDGELKDFAKSGLRELDFAGKLSDGVYAIGMPHSPRPGAEVVANRLRRILIDYGPRVGVAEAPGDGVSPRELLASASNNLNNRAA